MGQISPAAVVVSQSAASASAIAGTVIVRRGERGGRERQVEEGFEGLAIEAAVEAEGAS